MQILKVTDEAFRQYGKVIKDLDVSDIITAMSETPCPDDVVYEPSIESLEACKSAQSVSDSLYGGMPIQIGYCNGHNHLLNAVEYHRDSEINIAVTDLILILGKEQDITEDHTYDSSKMEAFLIPAGTTIEVYATTLHYARGSQRLQMRRSPSKRNQYRHHPGRKTHPGRRPALRQKQMALKPPGCKHRRKRSRHQRRKPLGKIKPETKPEIRNTAPKEQF